MSPDAARVAAALAQRLPHKDIEELAAAAAAGRPGLEELRGRSSSRIVRQACARLVRELHTVEPGFLAGALHGALASVEASAAAVDIVWTGPSSGETTGRLTSAVVVDLIAAAGREVILVSFAAQSEPTVEAALRAAVERGVGVTLLLERAEDNPAFRGPSHPFPAVRARRLVWPGPHRPSGAALHAKLLLVDGGVALVGSANLTERALQHNLECGVLLRGGPEPARLRRHVQGLIELGVLVVVS